MRDFWLGPLSVNTTRHCHAFSYSYTLLLSRHLVISFCRSLAIVCFPSCTSKMTISITLLSAVQYIDHLHYAIVCSTIHYSGWHETRNQHECVHLFCFSFFLLINTSIQNNDTITGDLILFTPGSRIHADCRLVALCTTTGVIYTTVEQEAPISPITRPALENKNLTGEPDLVACELEWTSDTVMGSANM